MDALREHISLKVVSEMLADEITRILKAFKIEFQIFMYDQSVRNSPQPYLRN